MAGKRATEAADFVTNRATYRNGIIAAEAPAAALADPTVPTLVSMAGPHITIGLGQGEINQYGRNAQLNLAFIVKDFTSVTTELWQLADLEERYALPAGSPAPPSPPLPATGEWVFVDSITIAKSQLWTVKDVSPGKYKVLITAVVGAGQVHIREQHAA
jgi:hypothetical protein